MISLYADIRIASYPDLGVIRTRGMASPEVLALSGCRLG